MTTLADALARRIEQAAKKPLSNPSLRAAVARTLAPRSTTPDPKETRRA